MLDQFRSKQFLSFLITGGVAACVNFSSRILFSHWLNFSVAIVMAYLVGMITAFFLAKLFVFNDSKNTLKNSAFYFILVNILAVAQTWLISLGLYNYLSQIEKFTNYAKEISHALGIIVPVFTSYLGHKHFSFK